MKSPITGKPMKLAKVPEKLEFRKDIFEIIYHCYRCEDSGEQYTDDDLDRINQSQVHNKYREKYGIPFPDEIREIREQYGVSASKMSEILGFGANSYRLYENGDIPSVANGRLILAIKHPKDFIKQVQASAHLLSSKEQTQLRDKAEKIIEKHKKSKWDMLFTEQIFQYDLANEFSGYKKPNFDKIANMITFFASKISDLYKTKLNKLLFYSDFGCFQYTGFSMSGITYRAIQMGPVPAEYDKLYMKLVDDDKIKICEKELAGGSYYGEMFEPHLQFDESLFEEHELKVLNTVVTSFKKASTTELIKLSHDEEGWIKNEQVHDLISYQTYAFQLKNFNLLEGGKR